jgi:hypothetical protein
MLSARNLRIPDWWTAAAAKKGQAGMGQTVSFAEAMKAKNESEEESMMRLTRTKILEERQLLKKPEQLSD